MRYWQPKPLWERPSGLHVAPCPSWAPHKLGVQWDVGADGRCCLAWLRRSVKTLTWVTVPCDSLPIREIGGEREWAGGSGGSVWTAPPDRLMGCVLPPETDGEAETESGHREGAAVHSVSVQGRAGPQCVPQSDPWSLHSSPLVPFLPS